MGMDFENLAEKKKVFESNQSEAEKLRRIVTDGGEFEQEVGGQESYDDLLDEAKILDTENKRIVNADHKEALVMNKVFDDEKAANNQATIDEPEKN
jgi:hypothetical protein